MSDHPSREELSALERGDLAADRTRAVICHLLGPCPSCLAAAPTALGAVLRQVPPRTEPAPEEEAAREAAFERAFAAARAHQRHLRREGAKAEEALQILSTGGFEALQKLPRRIKGLALVEALLARSWSLRHEDPGLMVQLAWLATKVAQELSAGRYGREPVADIQCRAWAELGNAYRVADRLDDAEGAFAHAVQLAELGTGDKHLGIRLLDLQASLAADRRRFPLARGILLLIYRFHHRQGDRHLAGRALIKRGLYTGYSGKPAAALRLIERGLAMIDESQEPELIVAAVHNQLWFLVDCGRFRDARKRLFLNRKRLQSCGHVSRLKIRWLEGRIDAGLRTLGSAERTLREVRQGLDDAKLGYQAALASLDLAAVLLLQRKTGEAQELILAAVKVFSLLRIEREALGAVLLLRKSVELRALTAALVEEVAAFLRRVEQDPTARFDPGE